MQKERLGKPSRKCRRHLNMFVQIHTLRDYSTALPNRGQDGLAKRTIYGGIERQRISSQSFKAALRDNPTLARTKDGNTVGDTMKDLARNLGLDMSVRSALIGERKLVPRLAQKLSEGDAKAWSDAVMGLWRREGAKVDPDTPLVVGEREIDALADACVALAEAGRKPDQLYKLFDSARELGKASPKAQKAVESMRAVASNAGLDGALFGRFATGIAVNNVDSAVHVAHLVTVHPLFSVTDFFSVQDLLKTGKGEERGGSHINTAELTSGLFYGYVVVDVGQLDINFAELTKEQRAGTAGWLVRAVAQVEPAAKLGSTAPYAGLRELMVEIGRRQPRSLIGAFERPVEATRDRSLSDETRHRLEAHASEMDALMGAPEYRSTLRQHAKGSLPAVEAISDQVAAKLATLAA
jgi:CRISPR system Cascade subunit CasC